MNIFARFTGICANKHPMACAGIHFSSAFFLLMLCVSNADRQVTFTCNGDSKAGVKGDAGVPGKRGPTGMRNPAGPDGPPGPRGNSADVTALTEQVRRMNATLMEMRQHLSRIPCELPLFFFKTATKVLSQIT